VTPRSFGRKIYAVLHDGVLNKYPIEYPPGAKGTFAGRFGKFSFFPLYFYLKPRVNGGIFPEF